MFKQDMFNIFKNIFPLFCLKLSDVLRRIKTVKYIFFNAIKNKYNKKSYLLQRYSYSIKCIN